MSDAFRERFVQGFRCHRRRVDKSKTNIKAMIKGESDCDDPYMMPLASKSAISVSDSLSSPP